MGAVVYAYCIVARANYYYYYYFVHLYCATSTMCNVSVMLNRRSNEDEVPLVEGLSEVVSF